MAVIEEELTVDLRVQSPTCRVLFATAEYAPLVKVGGLGEASSGLSAALRAGGDDLTVVMPDYGLIELEDCVERPLTGLASWCTPITVRSGWNRHTGPLVLLRFDGSTRPNPYNDPHSGHGWDDNTYRFLVFSAGVAALAGELKPDVLHLNDWHSASAVGLLVDPVPTVLTVHNLAYQGVDDPGWASYFGARADTFRLWDRFNPLAGAVTLADRVVMVSPSYAKEAMSDSGGFGLTERLGQRPVRPIGIRNGIDLGLWHPGDDPLLPANFHHGDMAGKERCRAELLRRLGLGRDRGPVVAMVARLVHQKGIDLALELVPFLERLSARLILIGSGQAAIATAAQQVASAHPDSFTVIPRYDEELAHLLVAGSDLILVPSRFEPCGLTQMQAMTCGTIPVVTAVGGLRDTVIDTDANPKLGTGYVADVATPISILDALHRATRGWSNARRRAAIQRRGMIADWSWAKPAAHYHDLYQTLTGARLD